MNYVNDIRLEQFLQLKKEIRGSTEHLIVGLDVGQRTAQRVLRHGNRQNAAQRDVL